MDYKRHERMGSPMTRSSLHKRATHLVLTTLSRGKRSDQKDREGNRVGIEPAEYCSRKLVRTPIST